MRTSFFALGAAAVLLALATCAEAAEVSGPTGPELPIPAVSGPGTLQSSSSSSNYLAARETAGPDTFAIYGGPDHPTEGKFQTGAGGLIPDWGDGNGLPYVGGPGSWTPVDATDQPVYWHVDTFKTENLNNHGAGNRAMWSGLDGTDAYSSSWVSAPGYGNGWVDALLYESPPLSDSSVGEIVTLDFFFNHDTESGYDFFSVDYDSAGIWTRVYTVDGSNRIGGIGTPYSAPGLQFSTVGATPIVYTGNDFGGDDFDQIRVRMIVESDGAWSDEDGLNPTTAGAAMVDDISMSNSMESFTEDFEGAGPYKFFPDKSPFAGDFTEVYPRITDVDPCRDNPTPAIGAIDFNQIVRNGPAVDGFTTSTGGSTSAGIDYGIVGNFVSNWSGGLSFDQVGVNNEIHSPPIDWNLPGALDDNPDISGALIRFDVWRDLPLTNGYFYAWSVRSALAGGAFDAWADRNFVFYGSAPALWFTDRNDVSDLLQAGPEMVQMRLQVLDFADVFGFPGNQAAPSPVFDNVAFYKYRIGGPSIATRTIDLANDGFPASGSIDVSTQGTRDALDIPFDMARDINTGDVTITPGDSVIVDVASAIPNTVVTDIRMVWALQTNPLFEDAIRNAPARSKDENVTAGATGTIWTGEVVADTSKTSSGATVSERFFVDLPDIDFMYPGDVLHYYIQATDDAGRTSTLPSNLDGFGSFGPQATYNRTFCVRGLPSLTDDQGAQPSILVYNDFGRRGGEEEWTSAFARLGYGEGVRYDSYTTQGPTSGVSNGIGSGGAHGANSGQVVGYEHIFYFSGNLSTGLLSNGDQYSWNVNDKSNDIDLMEQWHALPGDRNVAYFGDFIASGLAGDSPEGLAYLGSTMGVDLVDADVRDVIGGQTAPLVIPNAGGAYASQFGTSYVTFGGCIGINKFDQIQPLSGAVAGHYFTDVNGVAITSPSAGVASVVNPTTNGLDITFPYGSLYIQNALNRATGLPARALLFQEILGLFNAPVGGTATGGPAAAERRATLKVAPNPFNPTTTIEFTAAPGARGSVKIYNLRGELVRTLHQGEFTVTRFSWDGVDDRGASVASGVYVVRADDGKASQASKLALVK